MITVVASCVVKEDKISEYKRIAFEMEKETVKEDGCISYKLFQNSQNEHAFAFIEQWESNEHLEAHKKTKHFTELVPKMNELRTESNIAVYNKL